MKRNFMPFYVLILLWTAVFLIPAPTFAQNADAIRFDLADAAWKLDSGEGRLLKDGADGVSGAVLEITGNGKMSNVWELSNVPVLPGRTVMLRFKARRTAGTGGGMTGLRFANFDIPLTAKWETHSLIASVPNQTEKTSIRLGQWMISGTLQFAEVELLYLTPTYAATGLGADETVILDENGPEYQFQSALGGSQGNFSRSFVESTTWFNTSRWTIGTNGSVVYRFDLTALKLNLPNCPEPRFFAPKLSFTVGYHTDGGLKAFASKDGLEWTELGFLEGLGTKELELPSEFSGTRTVWVRFTGMENTNCQLYGFRFNAPLLPPKTDAADAAGTSGTVENTPIGTEKAGLRGATCFWELVRGDEDFRGVLPRVEDLPKNVSGDRIFEKELTWKDPAGNARAAQVRCRYYVADIYREDFGKSFAGVSESADLWWCPATWKVSRKRAVPKEKETVGLQISAARNDWESCQLVLNPKEELTLESVSFSPLKNTAGQKIAPEKVTARDVFFHFVENPTDRTGVREFYPDALPPLVFPKTLKAGENAPLWLTVYVPEGTAAGEYASDVTLTLKKAGAAGNVEKVIVPLRLRVWNFDIPRVNHSETAYGYSPGTTYRYHGARTEEDRRKLDQIYLKFLGQYRISPYHPETMDGIRYEWIVDQEKPENSRCVIDFTRFDEAMDRAMGEYGFTNFRLSIPGMGGGTFHSRTEPSLMGFGENTVEYQAMFASCVRQIEAHLKEKGWIKKAYVYWFDEPDVKDYEFVRNGMNRIKKYAPEIQTMLTEEPSESVIAGELLGKVDIWCPVTPNFDPKTAAHCKAKGERFWWYVCCWPREPYCTEFIDHSAVEMRTWLWQTWQNDVVGTLIWATNYWTSDAAYPEDAQDPYRDPMSYVSGYDTPAGTKRFWGNGDGRLYYPPLACATPVKAPEVPNFGQPVASIRFEMLREGLEDYEMLYLLREKLASAKDLSSAKRAEYEALLKVPESITSSMTQFSTDPAPIYERREKIAEAIEALLK
ncbi:MAG: DUF4091 domain-containing protein [Thermoguttaceae bacterium]|nr:DUF4091 domain-containing protein [Thermoguttaceae bacterium]